MSFIQFGPLYCENRPRVEHAHPGVHDKVLDALQEFVPKTSTVLDLGCGSGVLGERARSVGYNVVSGDISSDSYLGQGPFKRVDLNERDSVAQLANEMEPVHAVLLVEVIEHLVAPMHSLRLIAKLLRPGGVLIMSTPNVASYVSRYLYLLTGELHQFGEHDSSYGHINPITPHQLRHALAYANLDLIDIRGAGTIPVLWLTRKLVFSLRWLSTVLALPLTTWRPRHWPTRSWAVVVVAMRRNGPQGDKFLG